MAFRILRDTLIYFSEMVKRFSPREVEILFTLLERKTTLRVRVESHHRCRMKLKSLFQLIDEETVPVKYKPPYQRWINL